MKEDQYCHSSVSFVILSLVTIISLFSTRAYGYRVLKQGELIPDEKYFRPYAKGKVGYFGDPNNYQRERINEGGPDSGDQELLFEGPSPRQVCPGMVGPFTDGIYYCTGKEFGYCDKRSGTCFCNVGYMGIDCSECTASHYLVGNLCYPKKLCEDDCSGAGECNFYDGTCTCYAHRTGKRSLALLNKYFLKLAFV